MRRTLLQRLSVTALRTQVSLRGYHTCHHPKYSKRLQFQEKKKKRKEKKERKKEKVSNYKLYTQEYYAEREDGQYQVHTGKNTGLHKKVYAVVFYKPRSEHNH